MELLKLWENFVILDPPPTPSFFFLFFCFFPCNQSKLVVQDGYVVRTHKLTKAWRRKATSVSKEGNPHIIKQSWLSQQTWTKFRLPNFSQRLNYLTLCVFLLGGGGVGYIYIYISWFRIFVFLLSYVLLRPFEENILWLLFRWLNAIVQNIICDGLILPSLPACFLPLFISLDPCFVSFSVPLLLRSRYSRPNTNFFYEYLWWQLPSNTYPLFFFFFPPFFSIFFVCVKKGGVGEGGGLFVAQF